MLVLLLNTVRFLCGGHARAQPGKSQTWSHLKRKGSSCLVSGELPNFLQLISTFLKPKKKSFVYVLYNGMDLSRLLLGLPPSATGGSEQSTVCIPVLGFFFSLVRLFRIGRLSVNMLN
uniref:Uncharacterized protein n=1 Tax=Sphaerodactylus townsendi TaxID=933632 RepID=A0ACB8FLC4_9SAUR